jgi:hypothetical protein
MEKLRQGPMLHLGVNGVVYDDNDDDDDKLFAGRCKLKKNRGNEINLIKLDSQGCLITFYFEISSFLLQPN